MPMIVEARYTEDGRPEFDAADFKEMEAVSRGPDVLTAQEEAMASEARMSGNEHFRAGRTEEALGAYNRALGVFADRRGSPTQRLDKSKLLANRAECLLRLEQWESAEASARLALTLDAANVKARFRRARALYELGGEARLQDALEEIEQLRLAGGARALGKAEAALECSVQSAQAELREVRRRDAGGLRKAFAAGEAGLSTAEDDRAGSAPAGRSAEDAPTMHNVWCSRLGDVDEATVHAYLIDCYRTRVDDSRRGSPHGLADLAHTLVSVLADFLIFCKLAAVRRIVPAGTWAWPAFLREAAAMLPKAFCPEFCHPELRYGAEAAVPATMREVGARVFDDVSGMEPAQSAESMRREVMRACWQDGGIDEESGGARHMFTFDRMPSIFDDVGGVAAWRALCGQLRSTTLAAGAR